MIPFRVALAGLGDAGYTLHLPALAPLDEARVVGACDLDASRRERAAQRFGVPVFDDFDRMLDASQPDVVIVGTPPETHFDYARRAIEHGAHVICEKPFVSSVAEADALIALAARHGRRVALNHQFREMPIFRAVRDAANGSPENRVLFAQVWQLMDMPPWTEAGWRGQMLQRTLYEAGVHLVDFVMALFGEKPISVSASVSTCGAHEGQTDAVVLVTLEFSNGRLAQIVQNRLCKGERQYFEVRAETPTASLRGSFGGRMRLTAGLHRSTRPHLRLDVGAAGIAWRERGSRREFLARNPKDPGMQATRFVFQQTLAAFRDGHEPPTSAQRGRDVLEVIGACYHADATGRRVMIDSDEVRGLATMQMGVAPSA